MMFCLSAVWFEYDQTGGICVFVVFLCRPVMSERAERSEYIGKGNRIVRRKFCSST